MSELCKAKAGYFQKQIIETAFNPRTLWQTLKVITGENEHKKNNIQISLQGTVIIEA